MKDLSKPHVNVGNGGNEQFVVKDGIMSTLKANSDASMSHNVLFYETSEKPQVRTLAFKAGQSARGGLGLEWEVAQTMQSQMNEGSVR